MENKSNKGLIALVVILLVAVLGLTSYIVYDKVLSKEKEEKEKVEEIVEKDLLSEEEALSIGNELWEYAHRTYWGGEPVWKSHDGEVNEYGGRPIICDTTKEEVKQKYTKDVEIFMDDVSSSNEEDTLKLSIDEFIPSNACSGAGRGGLQNYKETNLSVKEIKEDEIIFIATSEYCGSSFCHESTETVKELKKDFIIQKENDKWLIASFYLPN